MPRIKKLKQTSPDPGDVSPDYPNFDGIDQALASHGKRLAEVERQLAEIRIALGGQGIRLA